MGGFGVSNNNYHQYDTNGSGGWVESAEQTQETEKAEKVWSSQTTDLDGNGNVTFTEHVHILRKAPTIPTLAPAANFTANERNEYYQSIYDKFGFANSRTLSHGNSVMFDIYAMMAIIQEIGQKMRNVMRMLRKVENQAVYLNIKQQAAIQREAAMVSMIVGAVMAAVQFVMMGKGLRDQLKGVTQQMKASVNTGADMAREQAAMTKVGGDSNLAKLQRASVFNRAPSGLAEKTPMTKYNAAKSSTNLEALKGKVAMKADAVTEAQGRLNKAEGLKPSNSKAVKQAKAELTKAKTEYEAAVKELDGAKMKMHNAALADVETYGKKFDLARQKYSSLANDPKASSAQVKEAKAEFQKAGEQYRIARAKQMYSSAKLGLSEETYGDVTTKADLAKQQVAGNEAGSREMMTSQRLSLQGTMILTLSQCFGSLAQSLVQGIRDIISAKATEMQAEQKVIEEQFDQIKDLFSLQQSVIQKAIDTLGSIFSREASINDQIMRV